MSIRILQGDCRAVLPTLARGSVQCCVTSPPYFGLRDYGHADQIGLEPSPAEYVAAMVEVFRGVRDVLADDGTLWLNIGDSYAGSGRGGYPGGKSGLQGTTEGQDNSRAAREARNVSASQRLNCPTNAGARNVGGDAKPKDLIGIPWMLAFALREDGWYLRQDIIWHKPNPMPESVQDRCTKAHEYVFLFSKSERYHFDSEAMREPSVDPVGSASRYKSAFGGAKNEAMTSAAADGAGSRTHPIGMREFDGTRNRRSVWTIATKPYSGAHFATMAPELAKTCILAGCPEGGLVLDPFGGAGTTGLVADRLHRNALLIELNSEYADLARRRIASDAPLFAEVES